MKFLFLFALAVGFSFPFQADAGSAKRLTPTSIQAFLDESSAVTHPETGQGVSGITSFLNDHIARRAKFESNIIYDIDGYPPQERRLNLNRSQFIKNITDGVGKVQDYSSFARLIEHDISNAGKKAEVIVVTSEKGMMPMQGQLVPFDGKTRCSQMLSWKHPIGIVVESASCETILTIESEGL